jgi:hypothetical protein
MQLKPKNWDVFQHYKDRCPPWIKLHRDLLNNRDYICLPLASKALAPLLWLLASESKDGVFDASTEELVFRLRMTGSEVIDGVKPLIDKGFFVIASGVLAERKQVAIPEREGETETETEKETKREKKATVVAHPLTVDQQVWSDWLQIRKAKGLPMTETAWSQIQNEFRKSNLSDQQGVEYCCLSNWAAFKTAWYEKNLQEQNSGVSPRVQAKQKVISGLTRGLMGGTNVTLLGK